MKNHRKIAIAVSSILSGYAGASYAAPDTTATADTSDSLEIQEIVVTATRRSESLENVPTTIQAVTGAELQQLNISTFDDLIRYTPNVTFSNNGPGAGNVFIRGLSGTNAGNQSTATTYPFPNVALYLDDESMQFPSRNVDVYLVDMERVEVLEGPQGTLFGGGAEAGAIRYITNKPKLDVTEGTVNAGYGWTAGGDPNSNANATINLPLIPDTLAVRATIFEDHRGGYISNVPATLSSYVQPTVSASNGSLVGSNLNTVDYTGIRLSALLKVNEDWNVLVQQNWQNMQANGYFSAYPVSPDGATLAPDQIAAFSPAYDKDRYESTSWTVNGEVANFLKVVYTGSYLDRHINQQADYSNYLSSSGGQYYDCAGGGIGLGKAATTTCYPPVGNWNDAVQNTHQSHEVRLSTPDENRLRGLVGAFWEDFVIKDQMNFNYLAVPQCDAANLAAYENGGLDNGPDCESAVGPVPGYYATNPALREGTSTAFGEDVERGYRQLAFFASVDFDIIPKVLTISAGSRYFHYDEFQKGSEFYTSAPANDVANGACIAAGHCGFGMNLGKKESGTRNRINLTYHFMPDAMVYYTYSTGFRPGGFNRTASAPDGSGISLTAEAPYCKYVAANPATLPCKTEYQYYKPEGYNSDTLINNEIGTKIQLFNHRVQFNASAYYMKWEDVQLPLFDPLQLGNTTFDVNGPTYEVKGIELQLEARVTQGLTVTGSSSWNSSNQTNAPCLRSAGQVGGKTADNPTPKGECITQINGQPFSNPFGTLDTTPSMSPPLMFNVRARYDWVVGEYKPFVSYGVSYIGHEHTEPASFPGLTGAASYLCTPIPQTTTCNFDEPGYTTEDASLGVAKDQWTVQLTGTNLSNAYHSTYTGTGQYIESETPIRPRVITLGFGYKF